MRVYDIITLKEELDVKPGVLGSDGKPISWQVVDKQTGRVAQTFSGPDADGKAEEFRDTENAKRRGGKPQDTKTDPNAEPSPDKKNKAKRTTQSVFKRSFKWTAKVGLLAGISAWEQLDQYQSIQSDLYARYLEQVEKGQDPKLAKEEFLKLSRAAFGQWAASSALVPAVVQGIVSAAKLGAAGIKSIVSSIRSWNVATTAASAATGPGFIAGVVKFIAVEGAIYAVIWALQREAVAKTVFLKILEDEYSTVLEGLIFAAGTTDVVANIPIAGYNLVAPDTAKVAYVDVQKAVDMRPMDKAAGQSAGQNVDTKAPPERTGGLATRVPD
jgi:hypothetical protein